MNRSNTLRYLLMIMLFVSCSKQPVKIACVGDSITEGSGLENEATMSYPVVLAGILGPGYKVLNCGRSGATLENKGDFPYRSRKDFYNVFAFQPDIIIIKLGTNDTKPQNWEPAEFEKDYQALIDTFNSIPSRPKIYICYPVPAFKTAWGINDSVLTSGVIPAIKKIGKQNHLHVIDLYHGMSGQTTSFPDGIHPNAAGAKMMASIIAREIRKR
jgi:acyl-CoA thioesterase-1